MEIDADIIKKATACSKEHKCLKNKENIYCKVERCINDTVLILECKEQLNCSYQLTFGICQICRCPVRIEIFNKYKI